MCTKCFNKNQPGSLLFAAGDYLQRHQAGEHPGGRVRSHSADRFRPQQGTAPRRQRTKGVLVLRHDRVHGPGSGQGRHPGTRYRKYKTLSITDNCLSEWIKIKSVWISSVMSRLSCGNKVWSRIFFLKVFPLIFMSRNRLFIIDNRLSKKIKLWKHGVKLDLHPQCSPIVF